MSKNLKLSVILNAVDKITAPLKSIQKAAGLAARDVSNTQKHIKELNRSAGQIDGYRKVSRSLGITSNELGKAQAEAQRLGRELAQTQNPTKAMTREFDRAQAQVKKLKVQQDQLTRTQRSHREILRGSGIDTRNLSTHQRDLTRQLGEANRALDQQKSKLERLAQQQKKLAKARQTYDNTKQLQGQIAGQGAKFAAGGAAAAYGAAKFLAPGLQFGKEVSKLEALTQLDKEADEFTKLIKKAREKGATTSFSATEVLQGMQFLSVAGYKPQAIDDSIASVMELSLGTGIGLDRSADIATNIASAFEITAKEIGRVTDALLYTSVTSNTTLESLAETMKYAAPATSMAGMTMEQTAAFAGMLGNIGIQGSMAGTPLKTMVANLAAPGRSQKAAMKDLGLTPLKDNDDFLGFNDILRQAAIATKDMGEGKKVDYFMTLFGKEAGGAISELIKQAGTGKLLEYTDQVTSESGGTGQRMAATMSNNADGDIKGLKSAWEDISIELFNNNDGSIRELIQQLTDVVRATGIWIKENPKLVATLSKIFAVVAGLAIAGGTLALSIAGIMGPFIALRYASTVLGVKALPALLPMLKTVGAAFIKLGVAILTTPVGWVLLAVAAIATAGYLIYKNWGVVSEFIGEFWQGFKNMAAIGLDLIKGVFGYTPLGLVINNWGAITGYFSELWTEIKSGFAGGLSGIAALIVNFSPLGLFYRAFAAVVEYFGVELPSTFTGFGSMILDGLIGGITGKLGEVKDKIVGAGESIKGWFKNTLGIKSPSKVFAQYGDDTMAGLAIGLAKNHGPEQQVTGIAKRLKAAGAAIAIGSLSLPAMAEVLTAHHEQRTISERREIIEQLKPVGLPAIPDATRVIKEQIERADLPDTAPAIAQIQTKKHESQQADRDSIAHAQAGAKSAPQQVTYNVEFNIKAAPGMSVEDLGREMERRMREFSDRQKREDAARNRGRLGDTY